MYPSYAMELVLPELITGYSVLGLDKFVSLIPKRPDPVLQPLLWPTLYQSGYSHVYRYSSIKTTPIHDHPRFRVFFLPGLGLHPKILA